MRKFNLILVLFAFLFALGCSGGDNFETGGPSEGNSGSGQDGQAGKITAGEWNDLDNWNFWNTILRNQDYSAKPSYWNFFTNNRISVLVIDNDSNPLANVNVELKRNDDLIWASRTDNYGKAELWIDLFQWSESVTIKEYQLYINNDQLIEDINLFEDGMNEVVLAAAPASQNKVEISFIVDATGSMGDELEFLKKDLEDVIKRVKDNNPNTSIATSAVFYKDEEDEYVTRLSGFTEDIASTLNFIGNQRAGGGGDYPEAVHSALDKAVNELQWSDVAKTRIAFLLLDAPPHYNPTVIDDLHKSIREAAKKGIKIIPITASGTDKKTEFLMRFFSISTNGTYVFITDHSGIGNDHIEPSVGEYQVEYLNDLMVRLINKYLK